MGNWIGQLNAGEIRRGLRNGDFRPGREVRAARRRLMLLTQNGTDRVRTPIRLGGAK